MATDRLDPYAAPARGVLLRIATPVFKLVLHALRLSAFGVLALARPVVIPVLFGVAIGGVGIWLIFVPIAHDTGFPSLRVLGLSVGCAVSHACCCRLPTRALAGSLSPSTPW